MFALKSTFMLLVFFVLSSFSVSFSQDCIIQDIDIPTGDGPNYNLKPYYYVSSSTNIIYFPNNPTGYAWVVNFIVKNQISSSRDLILQVGNDDLTDGWNNLRRKENY